MTSALERCRVVLVRPQVAGNLGAVARVMRNLGFVDLVLVAPAADPTSRAALQMSTHGEAILRRARIVAHLSEAIADCGLVAATSARQGKLARGRAGIPEVILPHLLETILPTALIFGPEPSGLTNEEIAECHYLIHIPTASDYPALNLAQAAAICLYELRRLWLAASGEPAARQPAPFVDQDRMFASLRQALEEIHFLYGPKADLLMQALRHLIGRAQPDEQEVKLLHGLARQIRWFARGRRQQEAGPGT